MILAVNVGNTQIVVGCMEGLDIRYLARLASDTSRTEYEYAVMLSQILQFGGIDTSSFEGAIISSVVPPLTAVLRSAVKLLTGAKALVVGAGIRTGLNIKIDNPAQLGSDLAVAAVAALERYTPPIAVVDMGTATTMTVIDSEMRLRGGAILPGVALSLSALVSGTSQLPKVPIEAPRSVIGTNTVDCMKSGAVYGAAAIIDGMADRFEEELGAPLTVVVTGGVAPTVVPYCRRKVVLDEELLLRGLAILYAKNRK